LHLGSALAHADESGMRVGGALHWLHVLCTASLTFYAVHAKRGRDALAAIGWLANFHDILVHDHWAAYATDTGQHAFCNAHHPRELIGIAETYPGLPWPRALIALLCETNEATCTARAAGLKTLPGPIAEDVFQGNPPMPRLA
jgi:transposase